MPNVKFIQPARVEPEYISPVRAILFDSFPPEERGDFGGWLKEIAEGRRWLYYALISRALIGFATLLPWVTSDAHLLEYIAIARGYRGRNFGAWFLQHIVKAMQGLGKAGGIILEVESDDADASQGAERELRSRRIGFYERNGAQVIECAPRFRAPNLTGGAPLREKLMWLPLRESWPVPRGEKLRELIIGIYTLDYGYAPNDPLLVSTLKDLTC